jgi:hypothetical protein
MSISETLLSLEGNHVGNSVVTQPPGVPLRQVPQVRLEHRSEHVVMRIAVGQAARRPEEAR